MLPNQAQRVIAHVDLDAFYTQVEVQRNPDLKGKPVVTVQYNPFGDLRTITPDEPRIFNDSNGSLIAVSYEARASGVKRGMRGDQARKVCPEVQLVQVPTAHGKADLTLYRDAGKQVVEILSRMAICERASIDECYLDLTEEAHKRLAACGGQPPLPINPDRVHICGQEGDEAVADWWKRSPEQWKAGELLLACGATAVAELRAAVAAELDYSCSAGIAHNKILAKLASGMHKPSQQTLVPLAAVQGLLKDLPIPKLRQLGGKFGDELMASLSIKTVGELAEVTLQFLESLHGDSTAQWLYRLARGCDTEEVKQRTLPKSISCGKTFRNHTALHTIEEVRHWLKELGQELEERVLEDRKANARLPQLLTVSIYTSSSAGQGSWSAAPGQGQAQAPWQGSNHVSRSCQIRKATASCMGDDATALVKKWTAGQKNWSIVSMFLAVSNFAAAPTGSSLITKFFKQPSASAQRSQAESSSAAEGGQSCVEVENAVPVSHLGPHVDPLVTDAGPQTDMLVADQGLEAAAPGSDPRLQAKAHDPTTRGFTQLAGKLEQPHAIHAGLQAAAPRAEQQADGHRLDNQTPVLHSQLQHHKQPVQAHSPRAAAVSASTSESVDLQRPASRSPEPAHMSAQSPVPAAAEAGVAEEPMQTEAAGVEISACSAARAGLEPLQCLQQRDQQGSEGGKEGCERAQQGSEVGQMLGSNSRLSCGKRPLEQSLSKEPEHRKRPDRRSDSGVDAPLYVNYSTDSIDESVLSELPASMQREIRLSMMGQKPVAAKQTPKSMSAKAGMHRFLKPRL